MFRTVVDNCDKGVCAVDKVDNVLITPFEWLRDRHLQTFREFAIYCYAQTRGVCNKR